MLDLYKLVLSLHIAAGLTGLAAFWTPAFARKGGTTHVQVGRVFYKATCVIAVTGLAMAALVLVAPLAVHPRAATLTAAQFAAAATQDRLSALFLVYLVIITFAPVYHGVRVLETRGTPETMRTPFHTALGIAAIAAAAGMIVSPSWRVSRRLPRSARSVSSPAAATCTSRASSAPRGWPGGTSTWVRCWGAASRSTRRFSSSARVVCSARS